MEKYCFEQSWINTRNPWPRHEICEDYVFIVRPKSWNHDNSIEKEIENK